MVRTEASGWVACIISHLIGRLHRSWSPEPDLNESSDRRPIRAEWDRRDCGGRLPRHLRTSLAEQQLADALAVMRRRRSRRPEHQGHRIDARQYVVVADRSGRRRREHDRRRRRVPPRHLRVELSGKERDCGRGADVRVDPRARPPHSGQRHRPARGEVEQEGVLESAGTIRTNTWHSWLRQYRPGSGATRARVRDAGGRLEPAI